ncbi:unnamed protein product [Moneuplotes crassus]|uniref:Uncharacterized protein n=1 Tax=Euplotes crassus TaxID=5936 RepID=A0AAD1XFF2_EUPCR|nr:unnamed protein product [Moneuplotes crassus]
MISKPKSIALCDINDPCYLYPGSVFATIANAEPDDIFSVFSTSRSSPQSQSDQLSPTKLSGQQVSHVACDIPQPNDFGSYLRKSVNGEEVEGTFGDNPNSGQATSTQKISIKGMTSSNRRDVAYKSAIRLLRTFYRNLFKIQNPDIVQKTYQKSTLEHVYERVHAMLAELIPPESFTRDLVYYTIGMVGIKKASELPCCWGIKTQITTFQRCTKKFSRIRFDNALESENLRTLARCLVQELDDARVNIFIEELS